MSTGGQYVVAAYGVILFALVVYVVVVGLRAARQAREGELLDALVERDEREAEEGGSLAPSGPPTGSRRA